MVISLIDTRKHALTDEQVKKIVRKTEEVMNTTGYGRIEILIQANRMQLSSKETEKEQL